MGLVQRNVQLNEDDIKWFENTHPRASLSAILGLLLEKYRQVSTITPSDYANIAAKTLHEELE